MIGKILGKKIASGLEDKKYLIMGIVLCIGSVGLLLGAVTCAIASLFFVFGEFSLVVSMMLAFFLTGFLTLCLGALMIVRSES